MTGDNWPNVDQAIVSYLTAQDGAKVSEMADAFRELGAPYSPMDVSAAVQRLAHARQVVWYGQVWLEKREACRQIERVA